jgi:hypothetical protein
MPDSLKIRTRKALRVAIALTPWLISMYVFFWLDHSEIWTSDTPHRGKISVAILGTGMLLSFLLHSHFSRGPQK